MGYSCLSKPVNKKTNTKQISFEGAAMDKTRKLTAKAMIVLTLTTTVIRECGVKNFADNTKAVAGFVSHLFEKSDELKKGFKVVGSKIFGPDGK